MLNYKCKIWPIKIQKKKIKLNYYKIYLLVQLRFILKIELIKILYLIYYVILFYLIIKEEYTYKIKIKTYQ